MLTIHLRKRSGKDFNIWNMGITVIGVCRVSSLEQSYQRQIDEIQEYCDQQGWTLQKIFTNKISGATKIEQRSEIMEMMDYIKNNHVDKVIALSVDRIGRSVAEASKIIAFLNEHKVSLYIKNYNMETLNPDGSINIMDVTAIQRYIAQFITEF